MTEREEARARSLLNFQEKIGYRFAQPALLEEALTHSSYAHELGLPWWNERLEFLGDAVLEVLTSDAIYHAFPGASEGVMTRARSSLVCESALALWGHALGLDGLLRAGKGQRNSVSDAMIADAVEALLGALYLDGGLEAARAFLNSRPEEEKRAANAFDPKSRLQILCQEKGGEAPRYDLIAREGPEHDPLFRVFVSLNGGRLAEGVGPSRKAAEQDAAAKALEKMAQESPLSLIDEKTNGNSSRFTPQRL